VTERPPAFSDGQSACDGRAVVSGYQSGRKWASLLAAACGFDRDRQVIHLTAENVRVLVAIELVILLCSCLRNTALQLSHDTIVSKDIRVHRQSNSPSLFEIPQNFEARRIM
jgi:hypothetical protein